MRSTKRFVKDVVLVGAADFLKSLRVIIVIPILTKLLGPQEYGMWVQLKVTLAFLTPVILLGLSNAIVRFLGSEPRPRDVRDGFNASVVTAVGAGGVLACMLFVFSEPLARVIFQSPGSGALVRMTALLVGFEALDQLALAYLQSFRQMGLRSLFILLEIVVEIAIVAALALRGSNLLGIVRALVAWKGLIVALKLARIWAQIGVGLSSLRCLKPYLVFGLPILLSSGFYLIVNLGDRYLINAFLGVRAVGLYAVAYAIGSLSILLLTPIDYVLYPTIAEHWTHGRMEEVRRYLRYAAKAAVLISVPVFFGVTACARELIGLFSTSEFLIAARAVPWIAGGFLLLGLGVLGEQVLLLAQRPRLICAVYGSLAAFNLSLNLVLILRFGILGAAVATFLTFGLYALATLSLARRYCPIEWDRRVMWKSLLAGLGLAAVLSILKTSSAAGLLVVVVAAVILYIASLVLLKVFTRKELSLFRELGLGWARRTAPEVAHESG